VRLPFNHHHVLSFFLLQYVEENGSFHCLPYMMGAVGLSGSCTYSIGVYEGEWKAGKKSGQGEKDNMHHPLNVQTGMMSNPS
jgi:hypothetical protein